MDAITHSAARTNLANTMDRACEDHGPIIIPRDGQQAVVMLSLEDHNAMEEATCRLRSPKKAKRLVEAIPHLGASKGRGRKLVE